jgi:hypothetical protein
VLVNDALLQISHLRQLVQQVIYFHFFKVNNNIALFGLSLALRAEFEKSPVRVNEYRLQMRVERPDQVKNAWEHPHEKMGNSILGLINSDLRNSLIRAQKPQDFEDHASGKFNPS